MKGRKGRREWGFPMDRCRKVEQCEAPSVEKKASGGSGAVASAAINCEKTELFFTLVEVTVGADLLLRCVPTPLRNGSLALTSRRKRV